MHVHYIIMCMLILKRMYTFVTYNMYVALCTNAMYIFPEKGTPAAPSVVDA